VVGLLSPATYENLKKRFTGQKERITGALSGPRKDPAGNHDRR
jgi:hypothetical protein